MGIPYCDISLNCVVGCSPISSPDSPCLNCWSKKLHDMRRKAYMAGKKIPQQYADHFCKIKLLPERLDELKHFKKPRTIFMCSGSDIFHPEVPFDFIENVFIAMENCQHTYLVLTKRIERAAKFLNNFEPALVERVSRENIILGVTIWNQESADRVMPILLDCWKGKTWISAEPLLGEVNIVQWLYPWGDPFNEGRVTTNNPLSFCVVGCESGSNRRPCKDEWIDSIADQCDKANVPCLIKQREINGKVVACKPYKNFFKGDSK